MTADNVLTVAWIFYCPATGEIVYAIAGRRDAIYSDPRTGETNAIWRGDAWPLLEWAVETGTWRKAA